MGNNWKHQGKPKYFNFQKTKMLPGKRKTVIQPATIKGKRQRRFKAKPLNLGSQGNYLQGSCFID